MTFQEFIEQSWTDHNDHAQDVADRLAAALPTVACPEHVAAYARIVTHVYGEHLGEWARGIALLDALRNVEGFSNAPEVGGLVTRGVATLRYAGGDARSLKHMSDEERAVVLATAASALTGRRAFGRALEAYALAVELAGNLPEGTPAFRSLAIAGNNLATALEELPDRDAAQTEGMVAAARGALAFWRLAGTWLEEQRAHYRLARSLLAAGEPDDAVESAMQSARMCLDNDAPPLERFFAYAALATALREAGHAMDYADMREEAMAWFDRVAEADKQWCEADLAELAH